MSDCSKCTLSHRVDTAWQLAVVVLMVAGIAIGYPLLAFGALVLERTFDVVHNLTHWSDAGCDCDEETP